MPPRVVLVGPPGSGKSKAARLVAGRLGVEVRDTDDDVAQVAGTSISDIFVEQGEEVFRALERDACAAAIAEHDGVLALGGGSVLDDTTRERLRGLTVVFLDVSIKDAAVRIGFNRDRPLLIGNPRGQWIQLMEARRHLYDEVATARVDTDGKTAKEVAAEVITAIGGARAGNGAEVKTLLATNATDEDFAADVLAGRDAVILEGPAWPDD